MLVRLFAIYFVYSTNTRIIKSNHYPHSPCMVKYVVSSNLGTMLVNQSLSNNKFGLIFTSLCSGFVTVTPLLPLSQLLDSRTHSYGRILPIHPAHIIKHPQHAFLKIQMEVIPQVVCQSKVVNVQQNNQILSG